MKKLLIVLCCFPLLMAHTCENEHQEGINCTLEARAGLNVTVSLGNSIANVSEGVTVIATDGSFSEILFAYDGANPVFSGVYERTGQYQLVVSKEGYQGYTSQPIIVGRDRCHVIPKQIHVVLQPL